MRILDSIRDALWPLRLSDPVLGELRFQTVGLWEGRRYFAPLGREIEFSVDAGRSGPTEQQRQFYREFEAGYRDLEPGFAKLLVDEWPLWSRKPVQGGVWDEFQLESFGIPASAEASAQWEVGFQSQTTGFCFGVSMRGWEPQFVSVDG
ncbi:MAG: hypothetical protein FJ387_25545 [Verrucomicrobia bacterium]|nr:hypothetical protein [Verrucomicrobiota bacterium]